MKCMYKISKSNCKTAILEKRKRHKKEGNRDSFRLQGNFCEKKNIGLKDQITLTSVWIIRVMGSSLANKEGDPPSNTFDKVVSKIQSD